MASSTDFKELFEKYQSEGAKSGLSIVKYCQMNGVVYSHFERWYKKYRAGVVLPVRVVDQDGLLEDAEPQVKASLVHITQVNLVFSNGLEVTHHDLSYQDLCRMIENLESLC